MHVLLVIIEYNVLCGELLTTAESPNKGHVGDNINSAVSSFILPGRGCPLLEVLNVLKL